MDSSSGTTPVTKKTNTNEAVAVERVAEEKIRSAKGGH